MLFSQRKTLAILRNFSILVPPCMYITKHDDLHAFALGLEPVKAYVLSSMDEMVTVSYAEVEAALQRMLCSSEEVAVSEQNESIFACSLEIYVENTCKMFFKLCVKNLQSIEEIVDKKLWDFQIERAIGVIGFPKEHRLHICKLVHAAFTAFCSCDAVRLVVDPLILTKSKMLLAVRAQLFLTESSACMRKDFVQDVASSKYPIIVKEASGGDIICIANGRPMALALADVVVGQGRTVLKVIDVGEELDENSIEKAVMMASSADPRKKILLYFFTGLTNCSLVAMAVQKQLRTGNRVGLLIEGTNVSGAGYVLHKDRDMCTVLVSISKMLAWLKDG